MSDDQFSWEGLACPPLDDFAFKFDTKLNDALDDRWLHVFDDGNATSPLSNDNYRVFEDVTNDCVVVKKPVEAKVYENKTICNRCCGNNGKGKELRNVLKVVEPTEAQKADIRAFLAQNRQDNKRRIDDIEAMLQPRKQRRLSEVAVGDNKLNVDFDSRMVDTVQKLHQSYDRFNDAKQRKKIQIIDFQKPLVDQQRCKPKSKGKASGTWRNKKKFHSLVC